mgnify:CR=1 FL=1
MGGLGSTAGMGYGAHSCVLVSEGVRSCFRCLFFFFNDTATTEIYTLALHDALPIWNISGKPPASSIRAGL